MLIAIGSDGNEITSNVAKRFGHAAYYLIYNSELKTVEAIENIDHDHSHSVLYDFLAKGTEAFIVGNVGPHAFEILNSGNAKIFLARKMTAEQAVEALGKNELEELSKPTAKKSIGHHDGHHESHHHHEGRGRHHERRHHK